jgi:hypothetical protein
VNPDATPMPSTRGPAVHDDEAVRATLDRMVRARQLLPSAEFVRVMGSSTQALSEAVASNRVFYVEVGGDRYFPAFFAGPPHQRAKVQAVAKALGEIPAGAKLQFFLAPRGSLGGATPLEALAQGKLALVKDVALAFAEAR